MSANWNPADAPTWCRLSGDLPQMNGNVVVMVDDSPEQVSSFFETEIPSLPENLEVRLLQIPDPDSNDAESVLALLRDTLASLIPEIGPEFATMAPGKWVDAVRTQRLRSATNDRWVMVDRFHHVLAYPSLERRIFSDILQQLAKIPSFGVIVGITTESAVQMAALLNLIESKDSVDADDDTRPLPAIEGEARAANSKMAGLWAKVAVAVLVIGLGLGGFLGVTHYFPKKENPVVVFGAESPTEDSTSAETRRGPAAPLNSAEMKQIEPAGHSSEIPEVALPRPVFSPEALNGPHVSGAPEFVAGDDSPEHEVLYFVAEAECFGHGVEKDLENGIALLKQSYEMGNEKAANLLGTCYSRGFGVSQDYVEAKGFFETAIDRGSKHAYGNLGVLYLRGLGVTKNSVTARQNFVDGAKAGDPVAAYFAAKCFENGIGSESGTPNQDLAVFWYLESAKGGHQKALSWCRERELLPPAPQSITF